MSDGSELAEERRALVTATRDIAEGEARVARQTELVDALRMKQRDSSTAEHLLDVLQDTLRAWRDHQSLILARIRLLEGRGDG